jgi:hypothetical protein
MTYDAAVALLTLSFGVPPVDMVGVTIAATYPGVDGRDGVTFVGLALDEHGDWVAVVRQHPLVLDLIIIHPSRLSKL